MNLESIYIGMDCGTREKFKSSGISPMDALINYVSATKKVSKSRVKVARLEKSRELMRIPRQFGTVYIMVDKNRNSHRYAAIVTIEEIKESKKLESKDIFNVLIIGDAIGRIDRVSESRDFMYAITRYNSGNAEIRVAKTKPYSEYKIRDTFGHVYSGEISILDVERFIAIIQKIGVLR